MENLTSPTSSSPPHATTVDASIHPSKAEISLPMRQSSSPPSPSPTLQSVTSPSPFLCPSPSSGLQFATQTRRPTGRKTRRVAARALSHMLISVLLRRQAVLLLVPLFYFWGMFFMMQGGDNVLGTEIPSSAVSPAGPVGHFAGSHSWGLYSLGEMLLQGVTNTTSFNFLVIYPTAPLITVDGDPTAFS